MYVGSGRIDITSAIGNQIYLQLIDIRGFTENKYSTAKPATSKPDTHAIKIQHGFGHRIHCPISTPRHAF
jgi:hypothetical protein